MGIDDKNVKEVVVFDFDGTCINGNSPVILVRTLVFKGMLQKHTVIEIMAWGIAYKFSLPQNEAWVRGLVFSAFENKPKEEVDEFLTNFYYLDLAKRFRSQADKAIQYHHSKGREVIVVSASFEPIILSVMKDHNFDAQISTKMKTTNQGLYTCEIEGNPVEGKEKLRLVKQYADKKFGDNNWKLAYAYGDHDSDLPLLDAAEIPVAVNPNAPLLRKAKQRNWTVLDWK